MMVISRNPQKGFTLIELLVVIAIIALLVSILLPSLNTARDLAKRVLCMSNQKAVGMGLAFYAQDENGYLLPAVQGVSAYYPNGLDRYWSSRLAWRGYLDYSTAYFCPIVEPLQPDFSTWDDRMYSYGMRDWCKPGTNEEASDPKPLSYIQNAGDFFILSDSFVTLYNSGWYKLSPSSSPGVFGVQLRHVGGAVTLFADNHIETINDPDYFETLNTRQGEYSNSMPYWVMD